MGGKLFNHVHTILDIALVSAAGLVSQKKTLHPCGRETLNNKSESQYVFEFDKLPIWFLNPDRKSKLEIENLEGTKVLQTYQTYKIFSLSSYDVHHSSAK